ncbi:MAG: low temperature requirement protein A [Thermoleophilaceae bacterium]
MSTQSRPSTWLRPPELRTAAGPAERHATWLELFFDLVLVAAISQLATGLTHDLSLGGFARFAGLFVPIAWAWSGFTFYANRFDTDDLIYRVVVSVAMLAVAAMAVNVEPALLQGDSTGFALSFVAVRAALIFLYARAWRFTTDGARRVSAIYGTGFSIGAVCWLASLGLHGAGRYGLWAAALAFELTLPAFAWRVLGGFAINASHITERYGLFFIIVLGEAVVAIVAGNSGLKFGLTTSLVAAASFVVATSLWWIYFDLADTSVLGRGLLGLVFVYTHFLLLAGVAALGAGLKVAIKHSHAAHLSPGARWAVCGGAAAYLLALAILHLAAEWTTRSDRAFVSRLVLSGLMVVLASTGGALAPTVFMSLVAAGLLTQLVLEALTYPSGAASVWVPPPASSSA